MRTKKLNTNVIVTEKLVQTKRGFMNVIEVDSEIYNDDSMFHDVTLETEYKQWIKNSTKKLFKN